VRQPPLFDGALQHFFYVFLADHGVERGRARFAVEGPHQRHLTPVGGPRAGVS